MQQESAYYLLGSRLRERAKALSHYFFTEKITNRLHRTVGYGGMGMIDPWDICLIGLFVKV